MGYYVEFETNGLAGAEFASVGTAAANAVSFADTTVASDTAYEYRVVATGALADSAPSNVVSVAVPH